MLSHTRTLSLSLCVIYTMALTFDRFSHRHSAMHVVFGLVNMELYQQNVIMNMKMIDRKVSRLSFVGNHSVLMLLFAEPLYVVFHASINRIRQD